MFSCLYLEPDFVQLSSFRAGFRLCSAVFTWSRILVMFSFLHLEPDFGYVQLFLLTTGFCYVQLSSLRAGYVFPINREKL